MPMSVRKITFLLLLIAFPLMGHATSKGLKFFYRIGERIDRYLLQNVDTNYITLPEHSWRFAYTNSMVGINSYYGTLFPGTTQQIAIISRTTPSVDLGFYAGYRGLGFGYSWDVLHAYANNLSFSLGSKSLGIEFQRQVSTNISGKFIDPDAPKTALGELPSGLIWMRNANLTIWYALNSEHYSHNAAIKQSFIQKRSAGSLLLSLSYLYTDLTVQDTLTLAGIPVLSLLMAGVKSAVTQQIAVGLGYGINYTPNKGKVILHAAANLQLVCYSINQISIAFDDSLKAYLPGEAMFDIKPQYPVHVTGNLRAAVSWEINRWVHLALWAQANNIRFQSRDKEISYIRMRNWNWQVHLNIGVRLGAGKKRVREALIDDPIPPSVPIRTSKLPKWITEYFYSNSL
jgi:hypothetical protein